MPTMAGVWLRDTLFGHADDVLKTLGKAPAALPSAGSSKHAGGNCRPCAHSWKTGGCAKGQGCTFCHLCAEGDFRRKRKEREVKCKAQKRGGGGPEDGAEPRPAEARDAAAAEGEQEQQHRPQSAQAPAALPSMGSAHHAEGACRPCAHSWKPGGCSKGHGCSFCHLCSEGDFRRKRKDRAVHFRAKRAPVGRVGDSAADGRDAGFEAGSTCNEAPAHPRAVDDDGARYDLARCAATLPVVSGIGKPRGAIPPPPGLPPGLFDEAPAKAKAPKAPLPDSPLGRAGAQEPAYIVMSPGEPAHISLVGRRRRWAL